MFSSEKNEILECPICCDILSNAMETICGHSFCGKYFVHNLFKSEHCLLKCLEREPSLCPGTTTLKFSSHSQVCRKHPGSVHPSFTIRRIIEEYRNANGLRKEQVIANIFVSNFFSKVHIVKANEEKTIGNKFYQQNQFADAVKHYSKAIDLEPNAILYSNRSICFYKLKQYRLCIEDADRAIQMDGKYGKNGL